MRDIVLGRPILVTESSALDPDLFEELRRIGVNLNQAVKFMHSFNKTPPELLAAAVAVERFITENLSDGAEGRG